MEIAPQIGIKIKQNGIWGGKKAQQREEAAVSPPYTKNDW